MSVDFMKRLKTEEGVGLLEVVVALFILAVGLLGVLALQANSIKGNQKSGFSTDAHFLAQDMVNRIQAYNNLDLTDDDDDYDGIDTSGSFSDPGCVSTGCTPSQQVAYDSWDWSEQLSTRLPGGVGTVDYDSSTRMYLLKVMWDGNQDGSTGTNCNGASGEKICYSLEFML